MPILFLLQSTLTLLPNIVDVHTMELTMNGETYSFTIDRTVNEEDSTEDNTVYDYTVTSGDGTALDYEENFKHFYLALISITVSEDTQDMPEGEPTLTCTYTYQDKPGSDTIEYYRVSDPPLRDCGERPAHGPGAFGRRGPRHAGSRAALQRPGCAGRLLIPTRPASQLLTKKRKASGSEDPEAFRFLMPPAQRPAYAPAMRMTDFTMFALSFTL